MSETKKQPRRWTQEEEDKLLGMISQGWDDAKIASELERTVGAQIIRRKQIAIKMLSADNPPTLESVIKKCNISEEDIKDEQERTSKNPGKKRKLLNTKQEIKTLVEKLGDLVKEL